MTITAATSPAGSFVVALYPYQPQGEGQLAYQAGDVITVVQPGQVLLSALSYQHPPQEGGWWTGRIRGQLGYFAATYVRVHQSGDPMPVMAPPRRAAPPPPIIHSMAPPTGGPPPGTRRVQTPAASSPPAQAQSPAHSSASFAQVQQQRLMERLAAQKKSEEASDDDDDDDSPEARAAIVEFNAKPCSIGIITDRKMEYMEWPTYDSQKDKQDEKEEADRQKAWKKINVPVEADVAQKKLEDKIRAGVPDFSRRDVWMAVTGAASLLQHFPTLYESALRKAFGDSGKVPTEFAPGTVPMFGGQVPKVALSFVSAEGKEALQRLLVTIGRNTPAMTNSPMMPFIGATLLAYMPEGDVYAVMHSMIQQSAADAWYFAMNQTQTNVLTMTFMDVLEQRLPDMFKHLAFLRVDHTQLASFFFSTLFQNLLPFRTAVRVFDCYLNEGFRVLYHFGIGLLKIHSKSLLKCTSAGEMGSTLRALCNPTCRGKEADSMFKTAFGVSISRKEFHVACLRRQEVEEKRAAMIAEAEKRAREEAAKGSHGVRVRQGSVASRLPKEQRTVKVMVVLDKTFEFDPSEDAARLLPVICRAFKLMLKQPRFCELAEYTSTPLTSTPNIIDHAQTLKTGGGGEKVMLFSAMDKQALRQDVDDEPDIWEEPPDGPNNLVFDRDGSVAAASVNNIIVKLTDPTAHDTSLVRTFIHTYDTFVTPERLLKKLIQRYDVPNSGQLSEEEWRKSSQVPIQFRVTTFLSNWLDARWCVFSTRSELLSTLVDFCDNVMMRDGNAALAKKLLTTIAKNKEQAISGKKIVLTGKPPPPKITQSHKRLQFEDLDEEEIARQLTLLDFAMLEKIVPGEEMHDRQWARKEQLHKCPNVKAMMSRFYELMRWVCSALVTQEKKDKRAKLMVKFIRIAEYLLALNDFHSLSAILSAFNHTGIRRLTKTRRDVPKKHLDSLVAMLQLMKADNNYKEYRTALTQCRPPAVPFLGLILNDLMVIGDKVPDNVGPGLVNWAKRRRMFTAFEEVLRFQTEAYNLQRVEQMQMLLTQFPPPMPDKEILRLSHQLEPPEG